MFLLMPILELIIYKLTSEIKFLEQIVIQNSINPHFN